jgi:hypothetical protein
MSVPTSRTEVEQATLHSRSIFSNPDPAPVNGLHQRSPAFGDSHDHPKPAESSDTAFEQALEAVLQEQVHAEAGSHTQEGNDIDIGDSFAPDPAQLAPESSPSEAAMVEDNTVVQDGGDKSDQLPIVQPSVIGKDNGQDDGDDDYEPPEATPPVDVDMHSPPFSPAPPESLDGFQQFSKGNRGIGDAVEEHHVGQLQVNGSVPALQVKHSYWNFLVRPANGLVGRHREF